jgi:hypothetical protein
MNKQLETWYQNHCISSCQWIAVDHLKAVSTVPTKAIFGKISESPQKTDLPASPACLFKTTRNLTGNWPTPIFHSDWHHQTKSCCPCKETNGQNHHSDTTHQLLPINPHLSRLASTSPHPKMPTHNHMIARAQWQEHAKGRGGWRRHGITATKQTKPLQWAGWPRQLLKRLLHSGQTTTAATKTIHPSPSS